jgi:hypothetical protein
VGRLLENPSGGGLARDGGVGISQVCVERVSECPADGCIGQCLWQAGKSTAAEPKDIPSSLHGRLCSGDSAHSPHLLTAL